MSFLGELHRAAHGDFAERDIDEARADGFADENARIAERATAIKADAYISADPARLAAALALAPTTMSIEDIRSRVSGVVDREALAARVAEKWAPRPEAAADPLGAADQTGKPDTAQAWSKMIGSQHAGDGAVASGGPFEPHPSAFRE